VIDSRGTTSNDEVFPTMAMVQTDEISIPTGPLRVLVVVPTLDERPNIQTVLREIRTALPTCDVLVVDDGSTDGTPELAEAVGDELGHITVLRRRGPRGLGPAYRAGFGIGLARGYDVLVEMDADLSHDPSVLPSLVTAVEHGADLAIGSRYVPGGATPAWPRRRRLLSRAGGIYARVLLRLPVHDVTSGYRAYRADLLRSLDLATVTSTGYGFQIDMTDRARRADARICEIPIVFGDRVAGESKMSGRIVREALLLVARRAVHNCIGRRSRPTEQPAVPRLVPALPTTATTATTATESSASVSPIRSSRERATRTVAS